MIRKALGVLSAVAVIALSSQPAAAQFQPGYLDVGPTIGLGGIGGAGMAFGGRFEIGINPLISDLGDGNWGIQGGVDIYSYDFGAFNNYSYSFISIGGTVNYHFKLSNTKIDPFLGAGLGIHIFSCDAPAGLPDCGDLGGLYFIGRAGIRYFVSDKIAIYGDTGAGAATIDLGLMFKLK